MCGSEGGSRSVKNTSCVLKISCNSEFPDVWNRYPFKSGLLRLMHCSLSSQNRDMLGCEYGVHGLVAQAEGRGRKHQQPLLLQGGHCSLPAMKWVGLWLRINWSLSGGWFQFWVTSCWAQSPNLLSPSDLFLPRYSTNRQIFGILRFRINSNVFTFYRHLKMLITTFCDWECYLLFFFF